MHLHLATVILCFLIGTLPLKIKKGTGIHKKLDAVYMILMMITAAITLLM
tara:strand:- start:3430 stop:3579 length:150 start_codon:yes stop_codon:yes gene_type:complete